MTKLEKLEYDRFMRVQDLTMGHATMFENIVTKAKDSGLLEHLATVLDKDTIESLKLIVDLWHGKYDNS